jgi:ABC-type transporter Mla maintaining outer membrane lipid asymmetry permease subunit MlaE
MNWFEEVKQNIEQISEKNIKPKEVRFYNLGGFITIAQRINEFSSTCKECENLKAEILEVSQNIDKYLNTSNQTRKTYEQKRDSYAEHLKTAHNLVKRNLYAPTYAFVGLLVGSVLGFAFAQIMQIFNAYNADFMKVSILIGWAIGLIVGRILGTQKDNKVKKEKRFY